MHFCLVDRILERSDDRIVTIKLVSNAEEYLRDHFPGFPVLPGVMMLEAMVQAGRALAASLGRRGRVEQEAAEGRRTAPQRAERLPQRRESSSRHPLS